MSYDYLAILDFEATCWEDSKEHEIIEFPTVVLCAKTLLEVGRFERFVRPAFNPTVSPFCHKLTTITQEQVNGGVTLHEALTDHAKFMAQYPNSIFVTCGAWDLKTMLPQDAARNGIALPGIYKRFINIKDVFNSHFHWKKSTGMPGMLAECRLKLKGTHHRGIDDCVNIGAIAAHLHRKGAFGDTVTAFEPRVLCIMDDCQAECPNQTSLLKSLLERRK
jgi:inhibitor of KinA sporulation pathway (predicted exonuclease)